MRLVRLLNPLLSSRLSLFCCCSSVPSCRLTADLCQWSHLPHFRRAAFLTSSDPGPTPPVVFLGSHCHLQIREGAPSSVVWSGSRWFFVTLVYAVTIDSFFTALLCTFSLSLPLLLLWYPGIPRLGHVARYLCTIFSTRNLTHRRQAHRHPQKSDAIQSPRQMLLGIAVNRTEFLDIRRLVALSPVICAVRGPDGDWQRTQGCCSSHWLWPMANDWEYPSTALWGPSWAVPYPRCPPAGHSSLSRYREASHSTTNGLFFIRFFFL